MIAKGFGRRLLVVLSVIGGLAIFGILDCLVCAGFRFIPPNAPEGQKLLVFLVAGPIVTALLLLAAYCVLYPLVNLILVTVTYLAKGEILTLGRIRWRIKERIQAKETEAYNERVRERKRIEAQKKLMEQDYEEALRELDKEFPGIKVENEIALYPPTELGRKKGQR